MAKYTAIEMLTFIKTFCSLPSPTQVQPLHTLATPLFRSFHGTSGTLGFFLVMVGGVFGLPLDDLVAVLEPDLSLGERLLFLLEDLEELGLADLELPLLDLDLP